MSISFYYIYVSIIYIYMSPYTLHNTAFCFTFYINAAILIDFTGNTLNL